VGSLPHHRPRSAIYTSNASTASQWHTEHRSTTHHTESPVRHLPSQSIGGWQIGGFGRPFATIVPHTNTWNSAMTPTGVAGIVTATPIHSDCMASESVRCAQPHGYTSRGRRTLHQWFSTVNAGTGTSPRKKWNHLSGITGTGRAFQTALILRTGSTLQVESTTSARPGKNNFGW
jgi:hypothetical protein